MQIIYFPYLSMGDMTEIRFKDVKIWNFDKKAKDYIIDANIREKVKSLLALNVRHKSPVTGIGIFSRGKIDFREATPEDNTLLNQIKFILFLTFIAKANVTESGGYNLGHYVATTENFIPTVQNFQMDTDYISESGGVIFHMMDGGYKINEITFQKPVYVLTPMSYSFDGEFFVQLSKISTKYKRFFSRLMRATDLFYQSYYNDPNVSINARILLQAGAFEVLLDLPESGQRRVFKELVEQYAVESKEKKIRYSYEHPKGKRYETKTVKALWADRFYTLRNHIIHGEQLKQKEFIFRDKQHHLIIAPMFFILLIKELINEKLGKRVFFDKISWLEENKQHHKKEGFHYKDNSILSNFYRKHPKFKPTDFNLD